MHQVLLVAASLALCVSVSGVWGKGDACFPAREVPSFPSDHLFHRLDKPIVIGNRGNPRFYQENTLDGFESLLDDNVGGLEVDIYLTKDKRLVLFHDDDTEFLTGESHTIYEMTWEEIQKLRVKDKLEYKLDRTGSTGGKKLWTYDKRRKIPLLEDLLEMVKDKDILITLEMKPNNHFHDMQHSVDTGTEVAKLVTKFKLEKKAVITSFDVFKTRAAKLQNPDVVVGNLVAWFTFDTATKLKTEYKKHMPGMSTCSSNLPDGKAYITYLLEHCTMLRAINGAFLDIWILMYNNPLYTNNTFQKFKECGVSFGGWTIYSMQSTEAQWDATEDQLQALIDNGGDRLITDNHPKLLKKLGRPLKKSDGNSLNRGILSNVLPIVATLVLYKNFY